MESRNRHKMVCCKICSKSVRSDTIKTHMKSHKDILSMDDGEVRARRDAEMHREKRRQEVKEIAQQESISIE